MTNIADTAATLDQRQSLRRHRTFATALLVAAGAVYLLTLWYRADGFLVGLIRAASEAALVGGLADWFAVTALFRRPLGLPIPHTAVIPNNKERIGSGLGHFIERHFLEPELIGARLRQAKISRRLGAWLSDRANADLVSDHLSVIGAFLFRSLNDQKLQRLVQVMLRRQLRETELAPALATLLAVLRRNGTHHQLFDSVLVAVRDYICDHEAEILQLVEQRSKWWVPRRVDRRMAKAITEGLIAYIDDLKNRDHQARENFDAAVKRLISNLRRSLAYRERINEMRDRVLGAPQVGAYIKTIWVGLRDELEQQLAQPRSRLRQALSGLLRTFATAIVEDHGVQARMDKRIEDVVLTLVVPWRKDFGQFVADVVRGWEASTVVDRIELAVGRDLQYIRINGTLVGAAVGCVIFVASHVVRSAW